MTINGCGSSFDRTISSLGGAERQIGGAPNIDRFKQMIEAWRDEKMSATGISASPVEPSAAAADTLGMALLMQSQALSALLRGNQESSPYYARSGSISRYAKILAAAQPSSATALQTQSSDAKGSADTTEPVAAPDERQKIDRCIADASLKYRLPHALIRGVVQAESGFDPAAVSPAGAMGLMQLMPATAAELGVADPFDIEQNIDGGSRYLRRMIDRFGGDIKTALAAYNAGPGTVRRYNGSVPYAETRRYVERVIGYCDQTV